MRFDGEEVGFSELVDGWFRVFIKRDVDFGWTVEVLLYFKQDSGVCKTEECQ